MKENKKIKNATICSYNGIVFKSELEKACYKAIEEKGYKPLYEPKTCEIVPQSYTTVPFYSEETNAQREKRCLTDHFNRHKILVTQSKTLKPVTYTPDFVFKINNLTVWVECKGFANDVYPYKRKWFRKYLETLEKFEGYRSIFFEVHNKLQVNQMIEIAEQYEFETAKKRIK